MQLLTFTIETTGAAGAMKIMLSAENPAELAEQLASAFRKAVTETAEKHSTYERYGDSVWSDPRDARLEGLVVEAAKHGQVALDLTSFEDGVRDRIHYLLAESFDDSEGLMDESTRVFGDTEQIAGALVEIADQLGAELNPSSEGYEDIDEWIMHLTEQAIDDADSSMPNDLIRRMREIRLVYQPAGTLAFHGDRIRADLVVPDENFRSFLELVNVSANHFIKAVRDSHGVDLLDPEDSDCAESWRALAKDNEPADPMRPPVVSPEKLVNIVDKSCVCAAPALVIDMPVETLLKLQPNDELLVKGGQVGLHDFASGLGHLISTDRPLRASGNLAHWSYEGGQVNKVYDLNDSSYAVEVEIYRATISQSNSKPSSTPVFRANS